MSDDLSNGDNGMEDLTNEFDPGQTHERHFDCICNRDDVTSAVDGELGVLAQEQDIVFSTSKELLVRDSGGNAIHAVVLAMRAGKESTRADFPLTIQFLARSVKTEEDFSVCKWYPVYDAGKEIDVTLTDIHEWANGMEATLEGTILDGSRPVAFYDTRYAAKKLDYRIGETFRFKLAALAYSVELLAKPKLRISAENADTGDTVTCVSQGGAQPDNCEFQSKIYGMDETRFASHEYQVLQIACARGDDGTDVLIPLVVRKDFFSRPLPRVGKSVRGLLWMQGYCV